MSRNLSIWIGLAIWIVVMALSIIVPIRATSDEIGLGAGLNRATLFFQFQFFAVAAAVVLLILSRGAASTRMRWLARLPGLVVLAMVLVLAGLLIWATVTKPSGPDYTPPGTITKPAEPTDG